MDEYLYKIARYSLHSFKLQEDVKNEVKKRIIDTIGVALSAYRTLSPFIKDFPLSEGDSTVMGLWQKANPEHTAFFNGFLARYLDFNDTYLSREPQHPSDVIMPLIALSEFNKNSGIELIEAIAVAYEIDTALCDWASLKAHGWDHVNYIGIATAAAASRLLGLSLEYTMNAIAITVVSSIALRQTRAGQISMWKGAAAANAAKNAIFSTLLAKSGISGPDEPFTGQFGFIKQLSLQTDEHAFDRISLLAPPSRILDTHIKVYPVEYMAQGAIEAVLSMKVKPEEIKKVVVEIFEMAYSILAKDEARWNPETRETADHSLPYLVARAIFDGFINEDSFTTEKINDPALKEFIKNKIEVRVNENYTKMYPEFLPTKIRIEFVNGSTSEKEVLLPRGHARNPLSYDEVVDKFKKLTEGYNTRNFLDLVSRLEEVKDVRLLLNSLRKST